MITARRPDLLMLDNKCAKLLIFPHPKMLEVHGRVKFITNVAHVALIFRTNQVIECNVKC